MKGPAMTLQEIVSDLQELPSDAGLIFESSSGPVGNGYHVTELKRMNITSIDCGGRVADWTEAALQLLDGAGTEPMRVGKFLAIVRQSAVALPGLAEAPLHVEFAPENRGMRLHDLAPPRASGDHVVIGLSEIRATCKPAQEAMAVVAAQSAGSNCCGPAQSSCCG